MAGTLELMKSNMVQYPSCEYFTIHKLVVVQGTHVNSKHILPVLPKNSKHGHAVLPAGTDVQTRVRPCFLRNSTVSVVKLFLLPQEAECICSPPDVQYLLLLRTSTSPQPGRWDAGFSHDTRVVVISTDWLHVNKNSAQHHKAVYFLVLD